MGRHSASRFLNGLAFERWTRWDARDAIRGAKLPGVYLLARFRAGVPKCVDLGDQRIVYIGETVDQSLSARWYQFGRSAFDGKPAHSGGWTFRECIGTTPRWLHVAALPVEMEEPRRSAFIRMVERVLIWHYVQEHGRLPRCNTK